MTVHTAEGYDNLLECLQSAHNVRGIIIKSLDGKDRHKHDVLMVIDLNAGYTGDEKEC